jgi:two-component system cell cycle sensor histidine kinase/response regulator CckA
MTDASSEPLRVLLVEDSPGDAELIVRELRRAGFNPDWRRVADETAYRAALAEPWDVILSDFEVPLFGGARALELHREAGVDVPFILVSGTMGEETAVASMRQGADDYLLKDRMTRLGPAIRQAREQRRLRRAQQRATEALQIFRTLVDHSKDSLEVIDPETGRFLDMSQGGCAELGYTHDEVTRLTLFDVDPTTHLDEWRVKREKLRAGGIENIRGLHRRKDGSIFPVEVSVTWVRLDRDYIVASARNLTARLEAEEALRQSEERFRQMAENIDEVFWLTDPAKQAMLYVSPSYQRIWGRTCEELYRSPSNWFQAIVPEDRERVQEAVPRQATGGYDVEYRIARPDGTLRWIHDRAFAVRDPAGRVYRIVGVADDITERKKLEEQFLHAQRMEAIGTLASGVAHDLNNILTPMLMAAGILRETLKEKKDQHILSLVEQGAQRGAGIVRQLLTFSRGMDGARVSVQLRHLLKEVENILRETFPKNIAVHRHGSQELWTVKADATQLHQVLLNLCVNARDAMPAGGTLSLEADNCVLSEADARLDPQAKPGPYVRLSVTDTGHGIPPDIIKRIFDPFFTTKGVGKGTGLGLSTVMGIAKNHGGFVRVYSEPGRGASFRVYLPAEGAAQAAGRPQEEAQAVRGSGELILLVDDEVGVREVARHALEGHGYCVVTAANGEEAISRFVERREEVRLVVTDIMMPVMDGVGLIRTLRVLDRNLKVIAMSGLEHGEQAAEFSSWKVGEVLIKPFQGHQLLDRVRQSLAEET